MRFGPAGWSYPDWVGPVYERGGGGDRGIELLTRCFSVVEVNTTYYHVPSPELARGWLRKVAHNPTFRFTAKLWRGFIREHDVRPSEVSGFRRGIAPLVEAGRLGGLLVQFPWSFRRTEENRRHLARLTGAFAELPLVIEVRHRSWDRPDVRDELRERGIGFCNIDQPLFEGSLSPTEHVTSEVGYVRLHGRNRAAWFREDAGRDERYDYRYSMDELRPWADRIRRMTSARRVFVITNNHFGGSAVANALELMYLVEGRCPSLPRHWLRSFPELEAVAGPGVASGQQELFRR